MARKPRELKEIERVRKKILDESMKIIATEGFSALTMRKLAKHVGMTAPNLYNYVREKDEIFLRLAIRGYHLMQEEIQIPEKASSRKRAEAYLQGYIRFAFKYPDYYRLMLVSQVPRYENFIGTPLQSLAEVERKLSFSLLQQAEMMIQEILPNLGLKERKEILALFWSFLHGLVLLNLRGMYPYMVPHKKADAFDIAYDLAKKWLNQFLLQ